MPPNSTVVGMMNSPGAIRESTDAPLTVQRVNHTDRIGYNDGARSVVASLRQALAETTRRCGRYRDAHGPIAANPLARHSYLDGFATIARWWPYQPRRRLKRNISREK